MLTRIILALAPIMVMATSALASDIMVINAHAPASLLPNAKTAAVYLTLVNHGTEPDQLLTITSSAAATAVAHHTLHENGIMKMRPLGRLELKPHESAAFEPGGNHIMLTGLKAPLKEGEQISVVMTFEKAGDITVIVPVVDKLSVPATTDHMHTEGE
jgi:periplasmic copper chaperone A